MKIFISIDLEGIPGVVSQDHVKKDGKDYERARKWMTQHLNAVINTLKETGINKILVNDSHGDMTNIILDEIPEDVEIITGNLKKLSMIEGIDECDAGIFLGYHSKAGSLGVLDHTYFGRAVYEVRINKIPHGEFGINALVAGYFNVPIIFVSGDDETIKEAKSLIENIEYVITKQRRSRFSAKNFSFKNIEREIKNKIPSAIEKFKNKGIKPLKIEGSVEIEVDFVNTAMADIGEIMPKTKRISPRTLYYKADNIIEVYMALRTWITLASSVI
ncbi:MAG: M55 family metallopeptidase [Candidatus Hydrothermales bacterium]